MFLIEIVTMIAFDWKEIIYKKKTTKSTTTVKAHVSKYLQLGFFSTVLFDHCASQHLNLLVCMRVCGFYGGGWK